MMQRFLIAIAVIGTLVSPVRAQIGQPSGQGGSAPANPQTPPAVQAPLPSSVGSSAATPGLTQYQPLTPSQLNAVGSKSNQTQEGPARPDGPLR
jgi:hypothetical protein